MDYDSIKELASDTGTKVTDYLAMSPKNDPFYQGTPGDHQRGRWFADLYHRAGYSVNRPPHLRRVHYWIISQEPPVLMPNGNPYQNTELCWGYLGEAAKNARYLDYISMNGIVDNKNPQPHIFAEYSEDDPGFHLYIQSPDKPFITIDGITVTNAQPYHLEVWCEKSTMNDVLLPVCQRYGANLVTFEGEVSITSVFVSLMKRIELSGWKPTRIFYISDFDPAGNSMPVAMSRKLEKAITDAAAEGNIDDFGNDIAYGARVQALALTAELVRQYHLPRTPIKVSEKRGAKFEANFGEGAVELDALEALYPGTLAKLVSRTLRDYYDEDAAESTETAIEAYKEAVRVKIAEIAAKYQPEIERIREMEQELKAMFVESGDFEIERADAFTEEYDGDWLYNSERAYEDQIEFYKRHKQPDAD